MPRNYLYTNPILNSVMEIHSVSWRHTVTKGGEANPDFGSKYYSSDLSGWLSVAPMASKFSNISPYAYVFNNPVMFIDKWGLEEGDPPFRNKKGETFTDTQGNVYKNSCDAVDIVAQNPNPTPQPSNNSQSSISNSSNSFWAALRRLDNMAQGHSSYNQADGFTLMFKTQDGGNNENAHLKPKKDQKIYDGRIEDADFLLLALGSQQNNTPGLENANFLKDLIDLSNIVKDMSNSSPCPESTVPGSHKESRVVYVFRFIQNPNPNPGWEHEAISNPNSKDSLYVIEELKKDSTVTIIDVYKSERRLYK